MTYFMLRVQYISGRDIVRKYMPPGRLFVFYCHTNRYPHRRNGFIIYFLFKLNWFGILDLFLPLDLTGPFVGQFPGMKGIPTDGPYIYMITDLPRKSEAVAKTP